MRHAKSLVMGLALMGSLMLGGCALFGTLPDTPKDQIAKAVRNWNTYYGANVRALDWSYAGPIWCGYQRDRIVAQMTAPDQAWFPSGDVAALAAMTAARIADDPTVAQADIDAWRATIDAKVRVGQHLIRVDWKKSPDTTFTTLCVADDTGLVCDTMFFNAPLGVKPVKNTTCVDFTMWWIWEDEDKGTRGSVKGELKPVCEGDRVVSCDSSCTASMTAGEAKIECKTSKVDGNCCQLEYAWGWACGFKSIKFEADDFAFEVEGILGSSGTGNGSCTECCEGGQT